MTAEAVALGAGEGQEALVVREVPEVGGVAVPGVGGLAVPVGAVAVPVGEVRAR